MPTWTAVKRYVWYLIRHKWYVFRKCASHGIWWRGLTHDLSKFLPSEFFPYVAHFHGKMKRADDAGSGGGYCKPEKTLDPAFEMAWFRHQKRNSHHWQWWVCITSKGRHVPIPMSHEARLEMVCDWYGAGMAQGHPDILGWYEEHEKGMLLHPETREWIDLNIRRIVADRP